MLLQDQAREVANLNLWITSRLPVVREVHASALSENVNAAFKNRPYDRNALPVCNAIRFNLN